MFVEGLSGQGIFSIWHIDLKNDDFIDLNKNTAN